LQQQQPDKQSQPDSQSDAFPAAKAGLVSQKQIAEGSDGFIWLDDKQQEKMLQQQQQRRLQQQQKQQQQQQGQPQLSIQAAAGKQTLPCFAGGQVSKGKSDAGPVLPAAAARHVLAIMPVWISSLIAEAAACRFAPLLLSLVRACWSWWCPCKVVLAVDGCRCLRYGRQMTTRRIGS
jgi:hypothetical protein